METSRKKHLRQENIFLDPKRRASEFDPSLLPQIASSKIMKDDPSLCFNFIKKNKI